MNNRKGLGQEGSITFLNAAHKIKDESQTICVPTVVLIENMVIENIIHELMKIYCRGGRG